MKRFLLLFLLFPTTVWADVDSTILRPNGDQSRQEWQNEACATTSLFASIDEATASDADFVTLDNCAGGLCTGCTNYSSGIKEVFFKMSDYGRAELVDSFRFYIRHAVLFAAGPGDSLVFYINDEDGSSLWPNCITGGRVGKANLSTTITTEAFSSGDLTGADYRCRQTFDNITMGFQGALNAVLEDGIQVYQAWIVLYFHNHPDQPLQPGLPPNAANGDTLFPTGAGFATNFTSSCAANWQCADDAPNAAGCGVANDSNWTQSTTGVQDYYALGTQTGANTEWGKRGTSTKQVDCIALCICVRKSNTGGTRNAWIRLGYRDSSGVDTLSTEVQLANNLNRQTFVMYLPRTMINQERRWDTTQLADLQMIVRGRVQNAADFLWLFNAYVVVYTSERNTSIPDSTTRVLQDTVMLLSSANWAESRQQIGVQDPDSTGKVWIVRTPTGLADSGWVAWATRDNGESWNYITNDSATIEGKSGLEHSGGSTAAGFLPAVSWDAKNGLADSFYVVGQRPGVIDSLIIRRTASPSQTATNLRSARLFNPDQHSLVFLPAFYSLGDTLWWLRGFGTGASVLLWSISEDRGATWSTPDTIPAAGSFTSTINTTTASSVRRLAFARGAGGYPVLFTTGWTANVFAVRFYQWHPLMWDSTPGQAVDRAVWVRNPGSSPDTVLMAEVLSGTSNFGEMVAGSVYRGGAANTDTIFHVAQQRGTALVHWTVNGAETKAIDTCADMTNWANNNNAFLGMATKDTLVYLFFNSTRRISGNTDTSWVWYSIYLPGKRARGPQPASFLYTDADSNKVQMGFPASPQYQTGSSVFVFFPMDTRLTVNYRRYFVNRITVPTDAAAPAATPLRRRRILLERNKPYSEKEDEKTYPADPAWIGRVLDTEE